MVLRNHFNDLIVVTGDLQSVRQPLAQLPAAAAKFTADRDDLIHDFLSFSFLQKMPGYTLECAAL